MIQIWQIIENPRFDFSREEWITRSLRFANLRIEGRDARTLEERWSIEGHLTRWTYRPAGTIQICANFRSADFRMEYNGRLSYRGIELFCHCQHLEIGFSEPLTQITALLLTNRSETSIDQVEGQKITTMQIRCHPDEAIAHMPVTGVHSEQRREELMDIFRWRDRQPNIQVVTNVGSIISKLMRPAVCHRCENYDGKTYGTNQLICAMHPYGWKEGDCPDNTSNHRDDD